MCFMVILLFDCVLYIYYIYICIYIYSYYYYYYYYYYYISIQNISFIIFFPYLSHINLFHFPNLKCTSSQRSTSRYVYVNNLCRTFCYFLYSIGIVVYLFARVFTLTCCYFFCYISNFL